MQTPKLPIFAPQMPPPTPLQSAAIPRPLPAATVTDIFCCNAGVCERIHTGRTLSVTKSDFDLVFADSDVRYVGKDGRLARSSVRVHLENRVEIFRFRRLILIYLRNDARPWTTSACGRVRLVLSQIQE